MTDDRERKTWKNRDTQRPTELCRSNRRTDVVDTPLASSRGTEGRRAIGGVWELPAPPPVRLVVEERSALFEREAKQSKAKQREEKRRLELELHHPASLCSVHHPSVVKRFAGKRTTTTNLWLSPIIIIINSVVVVAAEIARCMRLMRRKRNNFTAKQRNNTEDYPTLNVQCGNIKRNESRRRNFDSNDSNSLQSVSICAWNWRVASCLSSLIIPISQNFLSLSVCQYVCPSLCRNVVKLCSLSSLRFRQIPRTKNTRWTPPSPIRERIFKSLVTMEMKSDLRWYRSKSVVKKHAMKANGACFILSAQLSCLPVLRDPLSISMSAASTQAENDIKSLKKEFTGYAFIHQPRTMNT